MGDGEHGVMHGKKDMLTAMVKPVGRNGLLRGAMGYYGEQWGAVGHNVIDLHIGNKNGEHGVTWGTPSPPHVPHAADL